MTPTPLATRQHTNAAPATTGRSKSQLAREFIRERIANGSYVPGSRLVLDQIARELEVSPVPVREAIRLLEAEGLVTYDRNVGARVAVLEEDVYVDSMQTLALVEGFATALSAPHLTADDLTEAREVNAQLREAITSEDPHAFRTGNQAFHRVLARRCPNAHVFELVERGWTRVDTLRETTLGFVPGRARDAVVEHDTILKLLEAHADAGTIEAAARGHRLATLDAFRARGFGADAPGSPRATPTPVGSPDLIFPTTTHIDH